MPGQTSTITIPSLKGGLDDLDPPITLSNDVCTQAENVEFFYSTLGERRLGCTVISDYPTLFSSDVNVQAITWLGAHYPDTFVQDVELWALGQHLTNNYWVLGRRNNTTWSTVTFSDNPNVQSGYGHRFSGVSLHGKFFIAYPSVSHVDRLHVWDGTTFRKTGLSAPTNAPTAADDVTGGSFTGTRYYRIREMVFSGGAVILRSEPGPVLTFIPAGTKDGVVVTCPAAVNSNTTHFEIEASEDNANFYRITQTPTAVPTFLDTVAYTTGYANAGDPLSESLTSYTNIPSGKFLSVDADRLIIAGSWENSLYASRVWWTPTLANTGNGNDERLDMTVNPYIDLDGFDGGEITGLSRSVNGYLYAFKWGHIYKIVRTGNRSSAYNAVPLTTARGALPGSIVEAVDQAGNPAIYFLDPKVGPMRIGMNGLEWCGRDVVNTWGRINLSATVPCHGIFYQSKNQVHFWVALDNADHPNAKLVLQCNEMSAYSQTTFFTGPLNGARRGWSTVPVGNRIADAHCSIAFSSNVSSGVSRNQVLVPFIGKETWTVGANTIKDLLQICDTGSTDCFTTGDTQAYYYGKITTKPFAPTNLIAKFGAMSAILVLTTGPSATINNALYVSANRDYGVDTITKEVDLSGTTNQTIVNYLLDNLSIVNGRSIQFQFGDLNSNVLPATNWRLQYLTVKISPETLS